MAEKRDSTRPVVRDEEDTPMPDELDTTEPPAPPPAGFVAQDQVNAIATREAERAARAERQRIEAYLADQAAEAERQNMAEVDRLRAERDAERVAREAAEAARDRVSAEAEASRLLIAAGMSPTAVPDGIRLLGDDLDEAAVTALAERLPALFAAEQSTAPPPPPAGIPAPRQPSGSGGGKTPEERAAERCKALGISVPAA